MGQITSVEKGNTETLVIPHAKGAFEIKMPKEASKEEKIDALQRALEFVNKRKA